jgi:hypothetical protein
MSYKIPSIDLDDIEKIARDYGMTDKQDWDEFQLTARLQIGRAILQHGPQGPAWACGVHTTAVKPRLKVVDYAFDFRDKDGEELLPFFTVDQPLISVALPYTNLEQQFPELERVHTAKVGLYDNDTRHHIIRRPFDQKFDTFWLRYNIGFLEKLPGVGDPKRQLVDELCVLIHKNTRNKLEKRNSLDKYVFKSF